MRNRSFGWAPCVVLLRLATACGDDDVGDAGAGDAGMTDGGVSDATTRDARIDDGGPDADGATTPPILPGWVRRYGTYRRDGTRNNEVRDLMQTPDRGLFVAGFGWAAKLASNGEMEWQADISSYRARFVGWHGGEHLVVGDETSGTMFDYAVRSVALTSDGVRYRDSLYTSPLERRVPTDAVMLADGTVVVAGFGSVEPDPGLVPWVMAIATDGTVSWERRFRASEEVQLDGAAIRPDGSLWLAGTASQDIWVATLAADGTISMSVRFPRSGVEQFIDIEATADGGAILVGSRWGPDGSIESIDAFVAAIAPDGSGLWQRVIDSGSTDIPRDLSVRDDGGVVISVESASGAWLGSFASGGDMQFARAYEGDAPLVVRADDGGFFLTGTLVTGRDLWIAHTDADLRVDAAACAEVDPIPMTIVEDTIPTPLAVMLTVEDLTPHTAAPMEGALTSSELYQQTICGEGETTPWPTGALGDPCTCSPGSTCAGPDLECGLGLTCVGHYTSGGTPIAECSRPCSPFGDDCSCTLLDVGGTRLGYFCL